MVFGVLSLVCAAAIFTVPCIRRRDVVKAGASFRSVLRVRGVIPIASALAIANIGFVSSTAWVPKFLVDARGFTIVNAGLAFGLYSLSGGIGSIVLGWLSDRLNRSEVISSTSMAAAFLAMIYYVEVSRGLPTAALMAFSAILGFLSFAYWNLSIAAAQDLADSSLFGSVTGLVQDAALISAAAAPIISGGLISLMDMSSALIVSVSIPYLAHGLIFASYGLKTRLRR
jgi:sugar phosphate permease